MLMYGQYYIEVLFTKDVLAKSVVVHSVKSKKAALDQGHVQLIRIWYVRKYSIA